MSAPFSRTLEASTRLAEGLTVLMSIRTLPALNPARNPPGPSETDFKASVLETIEKVTSAAAETARGESPHFIPRSTSHCAFERVRLYPVTTCPLSSSLFTIWLPITPSPMNPRFAIRLHLPIKNGLLDFWFLAARGIERIVTHLLEMSLPRFPRSPRIMALDRI